MKALQIMPSSVKEIAQATIDGVGITVSLLWITGLNQITNDLLHTGIAGFTLLSVAFSLYVKIITHLKDRKNEQDK